MDSAVDETGKLLSGFAEKTRPEVDDDGAGEGPKPLVRKRATKGVETLEKSFEPLTIRHVDAAMVVDPLFRKTCAEFDESRLHRSLLSTLPYTADGRILFDSVSSSDILEPVPEPSEIDIDSLKRKREKIAIYFGRKVRIGPVRSTQQTNMSHAQDPRLCQQGHGPEHKHQCRP